jgi:hypothetical protein
MSVDREENSVTATGSTFAEARSKLSNGVRAVIARRAIAAGLCDADYFREIIAGRMPRITRLEAAREPLP